MNDFWTQVQPYVLTLLAAAVTAAVAYLEKLRRDLAVNTTETKGARVAAENGTALKERLIEDNVALRNQIVLLEADRDALRRLENAIEIAPEGVAFRQVLARIRDQNRVQRSETHK
jgi:hypothetical protein